VSSGCVGFDLFSTVIRTARGPTDSPFEIRQARAKECTFNVHVAPHARSRKLDFGRTCGPPNAHGENVLPDTAQISNDPDL
jgi:hypothetical protein